jgi:hypothetical protein
MEPVSKDTINKMRQEYENTLRKDATAKLKKKFPGKPWIEEATSAWVSRKDLEALLHDNKANGLRIYYGCHHESTNSDPQKDLHGLHNVILVATKDDVDPENPTLQNSKDQLKEGQPISSADYTGSGGDTLPLCPPNCP